MSSNGTVHLRVSEGVASILIDRPEARNAMTWFMYEKLGEICEQISSDATVRVATIRGAGGEAFVAGTDIEQFSAFSGGQDGIDYEKKIDAMIERIETLPMPTLAIVEGWAIGGGLAISAACDLRIATPASSFGVPIARTLGNCLSMSNYARVLATFGVGRAKRMLLLGETVSAQEAKECGFLAEVAEVAELDAKVGAICTKLLKNAPLTMRASKEALRRLVAAGIPDGDDLVRMCYGSQDFKTGVDSFMQKKRPVWTGS
ncbi:MAG: enoyl-CoA hydratase [Herminiimonas sp.]|nr:enoyl-CoA hydratase [Herminiimonas sp.]MDB5853585.1 enoyl-CoA hydratase [Herminiimonas sp.]